MIMMVMMVNDGDDLQSVLVDEGRLLRCQAWLRGPGPSCRMKSGMSSEMSAMNGRRNDRASTVGNLMWPDRKEIRYDLKNSS